MRGKRAREERAAFDAEFNTEVKAARRQVIFKQPAPEFDRFQNEALTDMDPNVYQQYVAFAATDTLAQFQAEYKPTPEVENHLIALLEAQGQVDLKDIECWRTAYRLLNDLGYVSHAPTAPVDELSNISTLTREGNKQAKKIAFDQMLVEAQPLFNEFRNHMRSVWEHPMTPADCDKVIHFCVDRNLGFSAKSYDLARKVVLKCLTNDELLSEQIEGADLSNYHVKRDIATQIQKMKEPA